MPGEPDAGRKTGMARGKCGVIIADRAYGTIAGMEYLEDCGSDYLLRYRTGVFNLYNERQERVEVTDFFQTLETGASGAVTLYYKQEEGYKPVRLCANGRRRRSRTKGPQRKELNG
jgi:hypothetical protein